MGWPALACGRAGQVRRSGAELKAAPARKKVAVKVAAARPTPSVLPDRRARLTPLPPVFPSAWAVACGEDRYGLWQAFEVGGVRQVMRWIPPGRFKMGISRREEIGTEYHNEFDVHLIQGFWLAETSCTQ